MAKKILRSELAEEDIYKGIRDSAEKTIQVITKINEEFKMTAVVLKESISGAKFDSSKGINDFNKAVEKTSKLTKETIKNEQELEKARILRAKADQQLERLAQSKLKTDQQAIKTADTLAKSEQQKAKETEKAAKAANDESNAYKQLEKNTRDLKNQSKQLAAQLLEMSQTGKQGTKEFNDLAQQFDEVTKAAQKGDAELKQIDSTVGDNFRNVGNYEGAVKGLKQQLREMTNALQNMDESDPRFAKMAAEAGQLRDKISDTKNVIQATAGSGVENLSKGFSNIGKIGINAFQGLEGGIALFGVQSEQVMQTLMKLQALSAMSDALEGLGGLGDKITEIKASFIAAATQLGILTTAKEADVVVTEVQTAATVEATVATNTLGKSMKGLPIVAIIAGIAALVTGLYFYFKGSDKAAESAKKRAAAEKRAAEETKKATDFVAKESTQFVGLIMKLKATNKGSKERSELIHSINKQYGTTLKNLKDETKFQAMLNVAVKDYIEFQKHKYQIQKNEEAITRNLTTQSDLQRKLNKAKKDMFITEMNYLAKKKSLEGQDFDVAITAEGKAYEKLQGEINGYESELAAAQRRLENYGLSQLKLEESTSNYNTNVKESTSNLKEFNTEIEITNEYISEQAALLNELSQIKSERKVIDIQAQIDTKTQKAVKTAEQTGKTDMQPIIDLENEKLAIQKSAILAQQEFELSTLDETYRIEKEKAIQALNDERDKLLSQEGLTAQKREEILKNYEVAREKLDAENIKQEADIEVKKQIIIENSNNKVIDLEKEKAQEIKDITEDVNNAQETYSESQLQRAKEQADAELEALKEKMQKQNELVKMTADYFIAQSEKKIAQLDKEIAAAEKQYDAYQQMAINGNIEAKESLAEQQKIINEANIRKAQEQRRIERIKLAESVYAGYTANVEKGEKNPLAKTITDITLLRQFVASLPTFYEGTDTTVGDALGAPHMAGRDGYVVRVDGDEKILNPGLSRMTGNMSTSEIARVSQDYLTGKLIRSGESAVQIGSPWMTYEMINKMDEMTNAIKNMPENSYELGQVTQESFVLMQRKAKGNQIVYNRYKVK